MKFKKYNELQIGKAHRVPHLDMISEVSKVKGKERIIKKVREKRLITQSRCSIRLTAYFSRETIEIKRQWKDIQSTERKRLSTKNSMPWQITVQN